MADMQLDEQPQHDQPQAEPRPLVRQVQPRARTPNAVLNAGVRPRQRQPSHLRDRPARQQRPANQQRPKIPMPGVVGGFYSRYKHEGDWYNLQRFNDKNARLDPMEEENHLMPKPIRHFVNRYPIIYRLITIWCCIFNWIKCFFPGFTYERYICYFKRVNICKSLERKSVAKRQGKLHEYVQIWPYWQCPCPIYCGNTICKWVFILTKWRKPTHKDDRDYFTNIC